MSDFFSQFIPTLPTGGVPDGYFVNPNTGQMTSRDLMRNAMQDTRGRGAAITSGAARGITFGGADEVVGALGALAAPLRGQDMGEARTYYTEKARAAQEADAENFGGTQILTELAASMSLPLGYFSTVGKGASIGRTAVEGAAIGGITGGLYGFNDAEENRVDAGIRGAGIGAGIGAAAGAAIPAATRSAQGRANRVANNALAKTAPAGDDLRARSKEIYDYLDKAGVVLDDSSFEKFYVDMFADLVDDGFDEQLTPTAARALQRFSGAVEDGGVSLKKLDTLRKVTNSLPQTASDADRRMVAQITRRVDDYVANLMDSDVVFGNAESAKQITKARKLWRDMKTSEAFEQAIEAAEDTASGFENGIRIEFRKLLKQHRKNPFLTDDELTAVREVVRGTVVGNWLKRLSKIGFGHNNQTNVLGGSVASGIGGSAGFGVGGPVGAAVGALAPAAIGKVGSVGAERATLAAANRARAIAASGGRGATGVVGRAATPNLLRGVPATTAIQNQLLQPR